MGGIFSRQKRSNNNKTISNITPYSFSIYHSTTDVLFAHLRDTCTDSHVVEYEDHSVLHSYGMRFVYSNNVNYIRSLGHPVIISYNTSDRMSWYKALDVSREIGGILIGCNREGRRRSILCSDIGQLCTTVTHYELDMDDPDSTVRILTTLVLL